MKNIWMYPSLMIAFLLIANLTFGQYYNSRTATNDDAEVGYAMYYADYLHGQSTALGEIYNKYELTAAHMTHPKGTLLKVTRLDNGKSVTVRVNDRGNFGDKLIVDLSWAAAMELDMIKEGKVMVRAEVVGQSNTNPSASNIRATTDPTADSYDNQPTFDNSRFTTKSGQTQPQSSSRNFNYYPGSTSDSRSGNTSPRPAVSGDLRARSPYADQTDTYETYSTRSAYTTSSLNSGYGVQIGSYSVYDNAERQVKKLREEGISNTYIREGYSGGKRLYRVVIGSFSSRDSAADYLQRLRNRYLADGIVVNLGN